MVEEVDTEEAVPIMPTKPPIEFADMVVVPMVTVPVEVELVTSVDSAKPTKPPIHCAKSIVSMSKLISTLEVEPTILALALAKS